MGESWGIPCRLSWGILSRWIWIQYGQWSIRSDVCPEQDYLLSAVYYWRRIRWISFNHSYGQLLQGHYQALSSDGFGPKGCLPKG